MLEKVFGEVTNQSCLVKDSASKSERQEGILGRPECTGVPEGDNVMLKCDSAGGEWNNLGKANVCVSEHIG